MIEPLVMTLSKRASRHQHQHLHGHDHHQTVQPIVTETSRPYQMMADQSHPKFVSQVVHNNASASLNIHNQPNPPQPARLVAEKTNRLVAELSTARSLANTQSAALAAARAHCTAVESGLESAQSHHERTRSFLQESQRDNARLYQLLRQSREREHGLVREKETLRSELDHIQTRDRFQQVFIATRELKINELTLENIGLRRMVIGALGVASKAFCEGRRRRRSSSSSRGVWRQERLHFFGGGGGGGAFLLPRNRIRRRHHRVHQRSGGGNSSGDRQEGDATSTEEDEDEDEDDDKDKDNEQNPLTTAETHAESRRRLLAAGLQPQALEPDCPICGERYDCTIPGHHQTILPCGHAFHDGCMRLWANEGMTCPYCREEFVWALAKREAVPEFVQTRNDQRQAEAEAAEHARYARYVPPTMDELTTAAALNARVEMMKFHQLKVRQRNAMAELDRREMVQYEEEEAHVDDDDDDDDADNNDDDDDDAASTESENESETEDGANIAAIFRRPAPSPSLLRHARIYNGPEISLNRNNNDDDDDVATPPTNHRRRLTAQQTGSRMTNSALPEQPRSSSMSVAADSRADHQAPVNGSVPRQVPSLREDPDVRTAQAAEGRGDDGHLTDVVAGSVDSRATGESEERYHEDDSRARASNNKRGWQLVARRVKGCVRGALLRGGF